MGLFANPLTLNDGVGNRIFNFKSQISDKKVSVIAGEYIEPAATIAAESKLVVKHDPSAATPRHLLQRSTFRVPAADVAGGLKRITVNFTIQAPKTFTDAEVATEVAILVDALGEANVVKSLLSGIL